MRGCTGLALVMAGGLIGWAGAAAADRASDPSLARPAFTATPAELLAAAKAAPPADEHAVMTMLRREREVSFDAQGRATVREHEIYVLAAADADDDPDAGVGASEAWRPSIQDRPAVRIRVVEPGGAVHELEPAKLVDMQVSAKSDRGMVSGNLPRPPAGSVVETETVVRDRELPLGGGSVWTYLFAEHGGTVTYSVPVGQRLRRVERALPPGVQMRHTVAGGRERWTYEVPARVEAYEPTDYEPDMPASERPALGATTAPSWAAVAKAYHQVIDRQIAAGPVALPASLPRAASRDTIEAIVAWLGGRVQLSPLEFGRAPYTPQPPATVMARGAQSATDRATLLVAVLRQAGIRAHLALIIDGTGIDVDPDLPGMAGFDHALVRARLAGGDVWIDPEAELIAPGRLPAEDQGRRALVIAEDTTGLITTPASLAGDNLARDTRTFIAPEQGPSALTIVVRPTGLLETGLRRVFRKWTGPLPGPTRNGGKDYYDGKLVRMAPSAATDLTVPFALTSDIADSRRVYNSGDQLVIDLPRGEALIRVPGWMKQERKAPRIHDVVWATPHVYEIENRIELPPGFAPPSKLPPDRVVSLGPATLSERGRVEGQSLVFTQRFDTGKRRWTAAELMAMQDAFAGGLAGTLHVAVDRTGYALREAGKYREAAAEEARMIALHPQEARHHSDLAELLIDAGLGDAARREAHKAVELAPSDPSALTVLGWVLHHDRLGRDFVHDWDRAGSLEVLRKARAIDPTHTGAAFELALVLERSPSGALYARGADLQGASVAFTAAREKSSDPDDIALRLAEVLLWAGQPIAAETLARTVTAGTWRDELIVCAVAETQGGKAAIAEAGKLRSGDERRDLIGDSTWVEIDRRHYDLARTLFAETPGSEKLAPFWAALLPHLAALRDVAPGSSDPRVAFDDLLLALSDPARKTPVFWDAKVERAVRAGVRRSIPSPVRRAGAQVLFGDMMGAAGFQLEGGDGVWHARITGKTPLTFTPYFALDRGTVKVIGTSALFGWLGHHALGLDLGDAAAAGRARRLLDLVRGDLDGDTTYRPRLFKRLWGSGKPTSREAIELAAAVLAGDLDSDRGVAIATRCPLASDDARLVCHAILSYEHRNHGRWAEAVKEYEAVVAGDPDLLSFVLGGYARALQQLGRAADADRLIDGYLAAHPDDSAGLAARYELAFIRAGAAGATQALDALARAAKPQAYHLNYAAWTQLQAGGDLARGVELAKRAVELARFGASERNTLAVLEAERGDLGAAARDNEAAMALNDSDEPTPADWSVAARIAEQLGQTDDAIAIYRKIAKPGADPLSSAGRAVRRLAALHAP